MGDGGFLGTPTLSTAPDAYQFDPDMLTFGYLYTPLRSLGLRTYELEEFDAFLEDHEGHLLFLHSDHDDPAGYPPEIQDRQDCLEEDDGFHARFVEARRREEERVANGEFADAYYALRCVKCDATYVATDVGRFRAFSRMRLPEAAADAFLARWGPLSPDDGWNHRLMPPLDPWEPFLEYLPEFLRRHRAHPLEAFLSSVRLLAATTGETLRDAKEQREANRKKRERLLSFFWPPSGLFQWFIRRTFAAWLVLSGFPLVTWMALGNRSPAWPAAPAVTLFSSALWTYLGARLTWKRLARTRLRTAGRSVYAALQAYSPFYLFWFLQSEVPALRGPLPVGPRLGGAVLDLHVATLPAVVLTGVIEGMLLWHYFHSVLGGAKAGRRGR